MGYDFDNSKIIKVCVIGGKKELINKIFPDSLEVPKNAQYKKRRLYKNIEGKDFIT
jgi:hypothetical protein